MLDLWYWSLINYRICRIHYYGSESVALSPRYSIGNQKRDNNSKICLQLIIYSKRIVTTIIAHPSGWPSMWIHGCLLQFTDPVTFLNMLSWIYNFCTLFVLSSPTLTDFNWSQWPSTVLSFDRLFSELKTIRTSNCISDFTTMQSVFHFQLSMFSVATADIYFVLLDASLVYRPNQFIHPARLHFFVNVDLKMWWKPAILSRI